MTRTVSGQSELQGVFFCVLYLEEDIGGEHKGEAHTGEEGQIGQPSLGPRHHELLRQWEVSI